MDRRQFIQSASTVSAASLVTAAGIADDKALRTARAPDPLHTTGSWFDSTRTWHFFDKLLRWEVRMRHARLFAIRGHFHFIEAQDRLLIEDGQPLVV